MIRLALLSPFGLLALAACAPMEAMDPPTDGAEQCPAAKYRPYVGRPQSQLPAAAPGEVRRVVCDTCAVTMDYNPMRVNVTFDTETSLVEKVSCG
ncbi:MAG: hemolysin [Alphaproteobacteria bacterium]|nr:hemolysin [Alphaproteobacteria bacterium]MBU1524801.1 hemolysin [Alphaproteobacteria bacterium]MBU2118420.1 hemolysin [Alphaproteobacteria bacterium]MBU2351077.1 hemolysin [Alphaproteobacteria bacterium]MBU2382027.1 hemolysin [Alphaproteobacteria bacterium]